MGLNHIEELFAKWVLLLAFIKYLLHGKYAEEHL